MATLAPHRPGKPDLRDNMSISLARGVDSNEMAVAIGPTRKGYYGSFQELGTKHHAAQPFARPAFDGHVQTSLDILAAAIWRELAAHGVMRKANVPTTVQGEEV